MGAALIISPTFLGHLGVKGQSLVNTLINTLIVSQFQDTAGEEKFSSLSAFYSRGAGAAILAFDPTEEETFTALRYVTYRGCLSILYCLACALRYVTYRGCLSILYWSCLRIKVCNLQRLSVNSLLVFPAR